MDVVEIRVHGVGGASPQEVLKDLDPKLVSGDETSGFWESTPPTPDPDNRPWWTREALAWGGSTSGTWRHALWILLLPFALVNLAGWMHRPGSRPSWRVRAFAVTTTMAVVMLTTVTVFDVIAIQCGGDSGCVADHTWMRPFAWSIAGTPVFADHADRRLALATLVPLALLTLLWFAGRYRYAELEDYYPPGRSVRGKDGIRLEHPDFWRGAEPAFRSRMLHLTAGRAVIAGMLAFAVYRLPGGAGAALWVAIAALCTSVLASLWACTSRTYQRGADRRLKRWLSTTRNSGWAVLGAALGLATSVSEASSVTRIGGVTVTPRSLAVVAVGALGVGIALVQVARELREGRETRRNPPPPDTPTPRPKQGSPMSALLLGAAIGMSVSDTGGAAPELATTGVFAGVWMSSYLPWLGLVLIQVILLASLFPRVVATADSPLEDSAASTVPSTAFRGRGPFAVSLLSFFLVLAMGAGVHVWTVSMAGAPVRCWELQTTAPGVACPPGPATGTGEAAVVTEDQPHPIGVPYWHESIAIAVVLAALVAAAFVWSIVRGLRKDPPYTPADAEAHLGLDVRVRNRVDLTRDADRVERLLRKWRLHAAIGHADEHLTALLWWVSGLVVAMLVFQAPWPDAPGPIGRSWGPVATTALWAVGLLPILGVGLLRSLTSDTGARRNMGRIWDVLTFWPRHVHPFSPPAYAERVVPQLRRHLDNVLLDDKAVMVAAHSQGSVLAAAAFAQPGHRRAVRRAEHRRATLVTYGSPLRILYARCFPAYFDERFFGHVCRTAAGWHNVYARTDVFALGLFDGAHGDPSSPCPVCAYTSNGHGGRPRLRFADYTIVDPERWNHRTGEPPPPAPLGHSAYHIGSHAAFDAHMATIADALHRGGRRFPVRYRPVGIP